MTGKLVISLDFELMWGVRDHKTIAGYGDAVLGARNAVPEMLKRFSAAGVAATWATVGLLFARSRDEMRDFAPSLRPEYANASLSPYPAVFGDEVGANEADDPYHFAASLIEQVAQTPKQEIATHTYSHYYCLEQGSSPDAFRADLIAAKAIAAAAGHATKSIVFPRNQLNTAYLDICKDVGLTTYRGNPDSLAYRARKGEDNKPHVRALRLVDSVMPIAGYHTVSPQSVGGLINVEASHFLRPDSGKIPFYASMHVAHIKRGMTQAAKAGKVFHLWWHPHNFGRRTAENLQGLDEILYHFQTLQDRYGFDSQTMVDFSKDAG